MAEDKHSKKHPASEKKKRDLKKKGTVAKSQDVPMATGLLAAFGALMMMGPFIHKRLLGITEKCIAILADVGKPEGIDIGRLGYETLIDILMLSLPVLAAVLIAGIVSNMAQSGLIFTGEQLKPNLKKINPVNKLKHWFSIKSMQDLMKSLAKIAAAGIVGWISWKSGLQAISESVYAASAAELMVLGAALIKSMFWKILLLYIIVAIIDFFFQRKNYATEHKMTDKEVRDEYKNTEGDPYMKAKRRQMAHEIAFNQSQDHVPQSDVVVINPTELAIALKYDPEVSPVPYVIAKGETRHADNMRSSAKNSGVPIVRNKPLARALWETCEIGDIIPEDLYRAVAEVLAYVFSIKEDQANAAQDASHTAIAAENGDTSQIYGEESVYNDANPSYSEDSNVLLNA